MGRAAFNTVAVFIFPQPQDPHPPHPMPGPHSFVLQWRLDFWVALPHFIEKIPQDG